MGAMPVDRQYHKVFMEQYIRKYSEMRELFLRTQIFPLIKSETKSIRLFIDNNDCSLIAIPYGTTPTYHFYVNNKRAFGWQEIVDNNLNIEFRKIEGDICSKCKLPLGTINGGCNCDISHSQNNQPVSQKPTLDFYDGNYDGYGCYDTNKYIMDHQEK